MVALDEYLYTINGMNKQSIYMHPRSTVSGITGYPVSYTHLDVYKRQEEELREIEEFKKFVLSKRKTKED